MDEKYDVLILTTPSDFLRVKKHYKRLLQYLPVKRLIMLGSKTVKELMENEEWEEEVIFLDEDKLIPFEEVNNIMKKRLGTEDVPRGITGWYYQQFLKMAYATICDDVYYMAWDGDTVPCKKIEMIDPITEKPFLDIKREYHEEYFITLEKLIPGMKKCIEQSFISEHMLFSSEIMTDLIKTIEQNAENENQSFYERILSVIDLDKLTDNSFSEFETYGTFVAFTRTDTYRLRRWYSFRHCGDFFDPDTITEEDFEWLAHDFDAVSFEKGSFVREDNREIFTNKEYREKLSARQILEIVQEEYLDGYKESWD